MNSKCMHAAEMTARSWGGLEIAGSAGRSIEWQLPKKNSARIRRTRAKQPYDSNVLDSQWLNLASQKQQHDTRHTTHSAFHMSIQRPSCGPPHITFLSQAGFFGNMFARVMLTAGYTRSACIRGHRCCCDSKNVSSWAILLSVALS